MSTRRKISIRKILQTVVTVIVTGGCIAAILSASGTQQKKKIKDIRIHISNARYGFIDRDEVQNILLTNRHIDLNKTSYNRLDLRGMERIIDANPWVENAQVYIDNAGVLHASITQRVPVVRIFEQNSNSYYLDRSLQAMPLSSRYTHYTTVVTNVPALGDDSLSNALKGQIVGLVKYIHADSFWAAQVSQVNVADDRTFELIPTLGEQRIFFGDTTDMHQKFSNLFAFYKNVLNRIGWDKYEVLDLRFNKQVVASPALPWKRPADKVISNMSWVTSIVESGSKAVESDTPKTLMIPVINTVSVPKQVAPVTVAPVVAKPAPVHAKVATTPTPVVKKTVEHQPKSKPPVTVEKPERTKSTITKKTEQKETVKETETAKETVKEKEPVKPKYLYQGGE